MELTLTEKFIIMIIHPEKGRFLCSGNVLAAALSGAVLLELGVLEKVKVEGKYVKLNSFTLSGDPVQDKMLQMIYNSKKTRKIKYWMSRFGFKSRFVLKDRLKRLTFKNVLYQKDFRFINIFPYKRYFFTKNELRAELTETLKDIALGYETGNQEQVLLLGLATACSLYRQLTKDRGEIKLMKKQVKKIFQNNELAGNMAGTLREIYSSAATAAALSGT